MTVLKYPPGGADGSVHKEGDMVVTGIAIMSGSGCTVPEPLLEFTSSTSFDESQLNWCSPG